MIQGLLYKFPDSPEIYRLRKMNEGIGVFTVCDKDGFEVLENGTNGWHKSTALINDRLNELIQLQPEQMTFIQLSNHMEGITQTPACKDLNYCKRLTNALMNSKHDQRDQLELF